MFSNPATPLQFTFMF